MERESRVHASGIHAPCTVGDCPIFLEDSEIIGESGVRVVAERIPVRLSHLALSLGLCRIGEAGARAVAERIPAELMHLALYFFDFGIGEVGIRAVVDRIPESVVSLI